MGLIIGVAILPASAHDNQAGIALLDQAAERCGLRLEKVLVDQGFKGRSDHSRSGQRHHRRGGPPQSRRPRQRLRPAAEAVVVEQVNGTLMLHRRLARDYDHRPENAASRVYWVSTAGMLRRLTTPTPAWRDEMELAA